MYKCIYLIQMYKCVYSMKIKSPAVKASTNYKKQQETLRSLRKLRTRVLSYLSGAFPDKVN